MKDFEPEVKEALAAWAHECLDYWAGFEAGTPITEEMVEAAPKPPEEFWMDATAMLTRALGGALEYHRGGDPMNPSPETVVAVAGVLDKAVNNALSGMSVAERRKASSELWDGLLDGGS